MGPSDKLAELPSLGWVKTPSPVTSLPDLAKHLGLGALTVKRDDELDALHGGNKARKLDVLLATPPFKDAPGWASLGAIGSGHLAACTAAAHALRRRLDAHVFFEPLSNGVLENLAFVASGPTRLHYYGSRIELWLRRRKLLTSTHVDGVPVIPAGGTLPPSVAGVARAGFELAEQIREGVLEAPDVVYCALGTGGTVAGLALGLGLAGVKTEVRAVAAVERWVTSARTVRSQITAASQWLSDHGVPAKAEQAVPVHVVRNQLGAGYGIPTAQSLAAVEVLRQEGVPAESVYTGKAFAALLADASSGRAPQRVLFWNTVRRSPLPHLPDWREKLPARLNTRIDRAASPVRVGRRVILGGGLAALGAMAVARVTGYPALPDWTGTVLARWEAHVLAAATPVLAGVSSVDGLVVAANVDRFLVTMPRAMQQEIHQLLGLVEHGTTPLGLRLSRFTNLPPDAREAFLLSLNARGGLMAQAFRGLRDLVLMGVYQDTAAWRGIGYAGPWPKDALGPENDHAKYEGFRAPSGTAPKSATPSGTAPKSAGGPT
jgi:D-cysteine desulfhydrase